MSDRNPESYTAPGDPAYGVAIFAGVLLATMGAFEILQGLSAVLKDNLFVVGQDYTFEIDITAWGWIHMLIGAIGVAAGIGILIGQTWANIVGIGLAAISALGQFMFMPYYPFWSLLIIAIDVLVIWALSEQIRRA